MRRRESPHCSLTSVPARDPEVGHSVLAEGHVPANLDVLLCLALLEGLVVVCLQLHQRTKDVLVLVGIPIAVQRGREGGGRGERGGEKREIRWSER